MPTFRVTRSFQGLCADDHCLVRLDRRALAAAACSNTINRFFIKNGNGDAATPNGQKIDTRGSGVLPIFEWQIASYERLPSGEGFENRFAEIGADSRA